MITIADVVDACRALPEPAWHQIMHDHPKPRMAVTLVPIVELDGEAAVVVTKRAGEMDHGGDWVFPGGRVDPDDASHRDAARREVAEELGVAPAAIEVLGQLATRGPIVTGYIIENFVGLLDASTTLAPDTREVADVEVIPLRVLLDDATYHRGPAQVMRTIDAALLDRFPDRPALADLRHYRVRDGEFLWGLQADILHELLRHLTGADHDF